MNDNENMTKKRRRQSEPDDLTLSNKKKRISEGRRALGNIDDIKLEKRKLEVKTPGPRKTSKSTIAKEYSPENYRVCYPKCVLDRMWREHMVTCESGSECHSQAPLGLFHSICWDKVSGKEGLCRFCSLHMI